MFGICEIPLIRNYVSKVLRKHCSASGITKHKRIWIELLSNHVNSLPVQTSLVLNMWSSLESIGPCADSPLSLSVMSLTDPIRRHLEKALLMIQFHFAISDIRLEKTTSKRSVFVGIRTASPVSQTGLTPSTWIIYLKLVRKFLESKWNAALRITCSQRSSIRTNSTRKLHNMLSLLRKGERRSI